MAVIKTVKETKDGDIRRSGITSPYFDLGASLAVAQVIMTQGGGTSSPEQLAHWLGYKSTNSGTYMTRISAASKHFGLVESTDSTFSVTERAKSILSPVMPEDAVSARVEAFLGVPLFAKAYEHFRGSQLPAEVGIKNLFLHQYKILPDRSAQAVRVFLNSAEQAGFFSTTGDRSKLIKPTVTQIHARPITQPNSQDNDQSKVDTVTQEKNRSPVVVGDGGASGVDTAIIGLLRKLPSQGASWTVAEQTRFLTAFTHTVQFLYPTNDEGKHS